VPPPPEVVSVKKWILTILLVVALAALGATAPLWSSPFLRLLLPKSDAVGLATNVMQWALWLIGAIIFLVKRVWRRPPKPPPEQQGHVTVQTPQAGRDVITATGNVQTGGITATGPVAGDVIGRDKRTIVEGDVVVGDKIIQTPPSPIPSLHQLLSPPADFVGREAELRELKEKVEKGGAAISGVRGMGGIGKTALALVLANQLAASFRDAQFFLDLQGTTKPLSPAEAMAHVIRSYDREYKPSEKLAEVSATYHSHLHGKKALLLMDNAADGAQVEPLIPPPGCILLVTSRQKFTLPGLFYKDLDKLPPEDARDLLLRIAPRIGDNADEIAKLCGYLPLALRAAASHLANTVDLEAANCVSQLRDERQRLERIGEEGVEYGVQASFNLSYAALPEETRQVFCKLAVFPGSFDAAAEEVVCKDAEHAHLSELVKRSLVEWNEETKRYHLHDLMRLFADDCLKKLSDSGSTSLTINERHEAQSRHAEHYKNLLAAAGALYLQGGEAMMRGLALFDLEWGNIQPGQAWAAEHAAEEDAAARLCSEYPDAGAYVLNLRLHSREWIPWLEVALTAAQRLKDRVAEGINLGNLGNAYLLLGETRRAIEHYEKALEVAQEIGDRRNEGAWVGGLGIAYAALGETRRAIEFYEKALVIDREIGDRRGEGNNLGNLGIAYKNLGEPRRAMEYYEKWLAISREIGDRRGEGNALGNLGLAYAALGETRRAMEFYEQQLVITREIGDRRGEGNALFNMALALEELGRREEAIANADAALKIYEEIEDPNAAKVRAQLAEWKG